jgi:hypothetical protein
MIAGTYGSIVEIANGYSADGDHQPGLVQTIPALYNSIIQMKMHASWWYRRVKHRRHCGRYN